VARVLAALAAGGRIEPAFDLAERRRARELTDRLTLERSLEPGSGGERGTVGGPPELLDAREIARRLPRHTALLEYVTGAYGAPTSVFVLSRSAADPTLGARVLVAADSLTGPIARLLALVTRGADISREARALGASLLDPAMTLVGPDVTHLIIVPDGVLHRVPWDALRLDDGRDAVERFAIGLAPSATLAFALEGPGGPVAPRRDGRVLAFGDPAFAIGADSAAGTYQAAFRAEGGLPRLPGSGEEARALTRYAAADLLLGGAASERRLKTAALARYSVLHFATHALVDDRIAVRTALALAPGQGEDGFVTPGELARLHLDADLVVLSGCRTAGGVVVDGEGMQGLTAPLLEAGARSVVATSWRVSDERIVPLVGRSYAALSRGLPVADALREAKLDARTRGAAPAIWSAFTVVGDPLATVALRPFARPDPGP
jgi:CHAT domain-containing protein